MRNRYNQAPHLTQDTNGNVTLSSLVQMWIKTHRCLVCIKDPNSIMFVSFRIANCAVYIKECRIERMLCLYMYVLNHLF